MIPLRLFAAQSLLRSQQQRLVSVLDRGKKRLHRGRYWKELAQRFPINGLTSEALAQSCAALSFHCPQTPPVQTLPGLTLQGRQLYYCGHPAGCLPQAEAKSLSDFIAGRDADIPPLIKLGLLVQPAAKISQPEEFAVVFSPHQDDASLSIGGTIASRRALQSHVICNLFTVSGWLGEGFSPSPMPAVTKLRQAEETLSNRILGAAGLGLDLWEAEVRNYYRRAVDGYPIRKGFVFADDPFLRTPGERDSMHRGINQLLSCFAPGRIYLPLGLGSHIDHVTLATLGTTLCQQQLRESPNTELFFYEDLPYATYKHVDAAMQAAALDGLVLTPHYQDITEVFEVKIQAIAAHRSQFSRLENEERLQRYASELANEAGMPSGRLAERLWRVDSL